MTGRAAVPEHAASSPKKPPQLPPARDGKSVAFYVAIFLSLLLVVSGALNVVLLVVSVFNSVPSGLGTGVVEERGANYE